MGNTVNLPSVVQESSLGSLHINEDFANGLSRVDRKMSTKSEKFIGEVYGYGSSIR